MKFIKILEKINIGKYIEPINRYTIYFLVAFLWAPHGAKECITICNGPNFVAPMLLTFIAPNWTMNMSLHGWLMQLVFAPPILLLMYLIFRFAKTKWGKFLEIYAVRWTIMYYGIIAYYNGVFWYGPLREIFFPFFKF
jgi:hypothetical protein